MRALFELSSAEAKESHRQSASRRIPCSFQIWDHRRISGIAPGLKSMGTAPASIGSLLVADGFLMALYAGPTIRASILYSSALG
jgi:hypothetical protein